MRVKIFIGPINYAIDKLYEKEDNECLIAVDKGAYNALKKGLDLDLVLGDFDSVNEAEKAFIDEHAKKVETFKVRKDFTDSYLAIKEALKLDPDEVLVYGGMGGRLDHTYANILLLKLGPITFINETHVMYILDPGTYDIKNHHPYISFFALEDIKALSLKGFSFELDQYDLDIDDPLCVSNQGSGTVSFNEGLMLVIEARD